MNFVKNNKFKITCTMLVVFIWICLIIIISPFRANEESVFKTEMGEGEILSTVEPINSEVTVEQTFTSKNDYLSAVSFCFDNMGGQKNGKVLFKLFSSAGKELAQKEIDMSELEDKKYYTVLFDSVKGAKDKEFKVQLTSTVEDKAGAVSVWYCSNDGKNVNAMVNGYDIGGVLKMELAYLDTGVMTVRLVIWLLIFVLSIVVVLNISGSYEKNFLLITGILGFIIIFVNPFHHAVDESTHFFRTFLISQGDFEAVWNQEEIGGNVPKNYADMVWFEKLNIRTMYKNPEIWMTPFSDEREFNRMPYMSSVIPVIHSFAAIPVFICRLLGLPGLFVILSGRIFTYLIYVVLCYFAIKKARYYKSMFFIIATLPNCIWLAGSYSIDPFLISASLIFSSICLRHLFDKGLKITIKEKLALFIASVIILSVKYMIYLPVLLLIFLIPKDKFKKRERMLIFVIGAVLIAGFLFWQIYLLKKFPFEEDRNYNVSVSGQISFVMGNLFASARIFLKYISDNIMNELTSVSSIKRSLYFIEFFIGVLLIFGSMLDPDKYDFKDKKEKRNLLIVCFTVLVVCILLILASLYVGFTSVGLETVQGIQTRYYYPIVLFAMLPISMINVTNNISRYKEKVSILMEMGIINLLGATLKRSI